MGKNGETDKSHKRHNSKSAKLQKKHELKKNQRKFKEERSKHKQHKKEKERLKKLKLASEAFNNKVTGDDIRTIRKVIAKLLSHNQETMQDLPQLFDMLDGGYEVDLSGLQDPYVMQKLNKVFKCLKLRRSEENKLEFKKREGVHDFKLKPLIQHFIDEAVNDQAKGESEGSSEEDESSREDNRRVRKSRSRSYSESGDSDDSEESKSSSKN